MISTFINRDHYAFGILSGDNVLWSLDKGKNRIVLLFNFFVVSILTHWTSQLAFRPILSHLFMNWCLLYDLGQYAKPFPNAEMGFSF